MSAPPPPPACTHTEAEAAAAAPAMYAPAPAPAPPPAFATPVLAQADADAAAPSSHLMGSAAWIYPEWVLRAEMSLAVLVRFPPLKPKLLERPPFAYVHDLLTSMHKRSEVFEQSGEGCEVLPSAWSIHTLQSKAARVEFIARLLQHTETRLGRTLGVQPIDVVESRACEATVSWLCEVASMALQHLRPKPITLGFSTAATLADLRTPAYSTFTSPARPAAALGGAVGSAASAAAATPLGLQSPWPAAAATRATTASADASLATTGPQTPASLSGASADTYAFAGASSSSASSTSSVPPRKAASPRRSKHGRLPPPSPAEMQAREAAATAAALTLLSSLQPERKASPVTVPVRRVYDSFVVPAAATSAEPVQPVPAQSTAAAAAAPPPASEHPTPGSQQLHHHRPAPLDSASSSSASVSTASTTLADHEIAAHQHQQHQALAQQYSQPETISRRPTPSRSAMLTASLLERLSPPAVQTAQSPPVLGSGNSPFSRRTPVSRTPVLAPAAAIVAPLRPIPVPAATAVSTAATAAAPAVASRPPSVQAQAAASSAHSSQHNSRPVTATPESASAHALSSSLLPTRTSPRPVDPSVVRETRQLLRLFLPSACLPLDRVRAPSFPLIHEVLLAVMHETGFGEEILPKEQPHLRKIAVIVDDAEAKAIVLQRLISYMDLAARSVGARCVVSSPAQLLEGPNAQLAHEFLQQLVTLALDTRMDKPALMRQFEAGLAADAEGSTSLGSAAGVGESKRDDDHTADETGEDDSFPSSACVPPYILSTRGLLAELIHASASPAQTAFLESELDPLLPLVGFEGFHRIVIMLKARCSFFNALWIEEADTLEYFYPPPSDFRIEEEMRVAFEARQFVFVQRVIRFLNLALQAQQESSGYAALTVDLDPGLIVSAGSPQGPNPTPLHAEESDYGRQVHGLLQCVIQTAMTFDGSQETLVEQYEAAYGSLDEPGPEEKRIEEMMEAAEAAAAAAAAGAEAGDAAMAVVGGDNVAAASASSAATVVDHPAPTSVSPSSSSASSSSSAVVRAAGPVLRKSSSREQEEQERAVEAALQSRVAGGRVHPLGVGAGSSPSQTQTELAAALAKQIALSSLQHPSAAAGPSLLIPVCIFLLGVALIVGALWFGDRDAQPWMAEMESSIAEITEKIAPHIGIVRQARAKVESVVRSWL